MKISIKLLVLTFAIIALNSCNQNQESKSKTVTPTIAEPDMGLVEKVLTQEEQAALTPDKVIKTLKEGNIRFTNNDLTSRNHTAQIRNSTLAQFPKAIILSCVDSRVPVEDVFDRGIGDLFVARVAGNFVNEDILGSMEFACKVSGSKLVLVLGHQHCGAVKAAIDDVKLGNITSMLQKIRPAVESVAYDGERNSKNPEFVTMVAKNNIKNTIDQIRLNSPILKEMEDNGEIKIVGAKYDMGDGQVIWME